ncbi:hypothetical protein Tco_0943412 [Tanacetum coccineum]
MPADMSGIPRELAEHRLNIHPRTYLSGSKSGPEQRKQHDSNLRHSSNTACRGWNTKAVLFPIWLSYRRMVTIKYAWPEKAKRKLPSTPSREPSVYEKMPFELKNRRATYQKAVGQLFTKMDLCPKQRKISSVKIERSSSEAIQGCPLSEEMGTCKKKPIYFVNRALQGSKINYPNLEKVTYALRFNFRTSNNEGEYEALVTGLELAIKMEA